MFVPFVFFTFCIGTLYGSPPPFEIVDSVSRGKIVVARKNFLPGEIVVEDKEPLLTLTWPPDQEPSESDLAFQSYDVFTKELSPAQKDKFMTLFGPNTGSYADDIRVLAKQHKKCNPKTGSNETLTSEEIQTFVKVNSIVRTNAFQVDGGCAAVYDLTSCFAHSCHPNCKHDRTDKMCYIRTCVPIAAGEELTVSYMDFERITMPTHMRRLHTLLSKEFTCHCLRCDAPGDDTRQFDCVDKKCKGVMMMCQPVNKQDLPLTDLSYGVEYVEPHLLPCTVCKLTPPPSYTADMLTLESSLTSLALRYIQEFNTLMSNRAGPKELVTFVRKFDAYHIPLRHAKAISIVLCRAYCCMGIFVKGGVLYREQARRAVQAVIKRQEGILPFPNDSTHTSTLPLLSLLINMTTPHRPSLFTPPELKEMLQKALRLRLMLEGREKRDDGVDGMLLGVLEQLPTPVPSPEVCAFCEESPRRAALTLSRCGRCRQVAYCSVGCQKAHWKLHEKTCNALSDNHFNL